MIVCPECRQVLLKEKNHYLCEKCNHKYPIIKHVPYFAEHIDEKEYDFDEYAVEISKIADAEKDHFWFKSRRKLILQIFKKYVSFQNSIIEIGAGTGSISRMLKNNGYNVSIGEIHPNGIEYALKKNSGDLPIYQFDIMKNPFESHFDVIGLFDVLEHIKDEKQALENIYNMLKPGGKIVLTVPAHMWLWCEEDEVSNHFRRYELEDLKKMLSHKGFTIKYATNFFISIVPLLYLRTKMSSGPNIRINPIVNSILMTLSRIENKILKIISSKIGGSIIIVAEKQYD